MAALPLKMLWQPLRNEATAFNNPTNLDRVCTSNLLHVFSRLTVFIHVKEFNDTVKLIIFTLTAQIYPSSNALIYADQPSHRVALPLNRWRGRFSDLP